MIYLVLTYGCNLACPYCYQKDIHSADVATPWVVDRMVETGLGSRYILWGGEPLMKENHRVVEHALRYAKGVVTNGKDLEHFVPYMWRVENVQVTLDGPREVHNERRGAFDRIVDGVDAALKAGISVTARTNVDHENVSSLPWLAQFYYQRGWLKHKFEAYISFTNGVPVEIDLGDHPLAHVFQIPEEECGARENAWALDLYGDVYKCPQSVGRKEMSVGRFLPELSLDEGKIEEWKDSTGCPFVRCI